jgi:hypothetical protein
MNFITFSVGLPKFFRFAVADRIIIIFQPKGQSPRGAPGPPSALDSNAGFAQIN